MIVQLRALYLQEGFVQGCIPRQCLHACSLDYQAHGSYRSSCKDAN